MNNSSRGSRSSSEKSSSKRIINKTSNGRKNISVGSGGVSISTLSNISSSSRSRSTIITVLVRKVIVALGLFM